MSMQKFGFQVKARPWYEWLLWVVWLVAEVFFLQNAISSRVEHQGTAATIFWVIFGIILVAGVVVWIVRRPE